MFLSRLGLVSLAKMYVDRAAQGLLSTATTRNTTVNPGRECHASSFDPVTSEQESNQLNNTNVQSDIVTKKSTQRSLLSRANSALNRVELIGGVAMNPIYFLSNSGREMGKFRLITNINFLGRDGEVAEQKEVHEIVVFGSLVRYCQDNVSRGNRLFVSGRITYSDQVAGLETRSAHIVADTVLATTSKKTSEKQATKTD